MFFWRSQQNLDVVIHENEPEGVVIVSTRSFERGTVFPPIFLEATRLPITRQQIAKAVEDKVGCLWSGDGMDCVVCFPHNEASTGGTPVAAPQEGA